MSATAALLGGIKASLRARGLTYSDLSRLIGVSHATGDLVGAGNRFGQRITSVRVVELADVSVHRYISSVC